MGDEPMNLNDIQMRYQNDFPLWNKDFQCFPEGPIFYDKMFKQEPLKRAIDIEKKLQKLKKKVTVISFIPFDSDNDNDDAIVTKTVDEIIQSLQVLISYLQLTNNARVKNGLPKVLNRKVKGSLLQLKNSKKAVAIIQEIQEEAFDMTIRNDETCRKEIGYYEMR